MAEPFQPHVGDIGTVLRISIVELPPGVTDPTLAQPVPLTTATNKKFIIVTPTKRRYVVDAIFDDTDGANGKLLYVTKGTQDGNPADLDVAGRYKMQATFDMDGGSWSSDIVVFAVSPNL